jgi:hypothetical protein
MPFTARGSREPGSSLTDDRFSPVRMGHSGACLLRRLDRRPAATSHRATEAGTGKADHRVVNGMMASRIVICGHGHQGRLFL